jgi:hypothetical protein
VFLCCVFVINSLESQGDLSSAVNTLLSARVYLVSLNDSRSCVVSRVFGVTAASHLQVSSSSTFVSCIVGGTINVSVTGGVLPLTFSWSNGAFTEDLINVPVGSYNLTVSDALGCVVRSAHQVVSPPFIVALSDPGNATCGGSRNISAQVVVGGSPPFSYAWSNGATTSAIQVSQQGFYSVTVTDSNGCVALSAYAFPVISTNFSVALFQRTQCSAAVTRANISSIVYGGTPPYRYLWSTNATSSSIQNVSIGLYNLVVFDTHNCTATSSYSLVLQSTLFVTIQRSFSCANGENSVAAVGFGGLPPYQYSWNTGSTGAFLPDVASNDTYSVSVLDAGGCSASATSLAVSNLGITVTIVQVPACGNATTIVAIVSGGTPPYHYLWSNNVTGLPILQNVPPGTYVLRVTDSSNCSSISSFTSNIISCGGAGIVRQSQYFDAGCTLPVTQLSFRNSSCLTDLNSTINCRLDTITGYYLKVECLTVFEDPNPALFTILQTGYSLSNCTGTKMFYQGIAGGCLLSSNGQAVSGSFTTQCLAASFSYSQYQTRNCTGPTLPQTVATGCAATPGGYVGDAHFSSVQNSC